MVVYLPAQRAAMYPGRRWCTWMYGTRNETVETCSLGSDAWQPAVRAGVLSERGDGQTKGDNHGEVCGLLHLHKRRMGADDQEPWRPDRGGAAAGRLGG